MKNAKNLTGVSYGMVNENMIGVTEAGDLVFDLSWVDWVFKDKRPAILISKNPAKLFEIMEDETHKQHVAGKHDFVPNVIIHCTITGFGGTKLEPNVPKPGVSIEAYKKFVEWLGKDKVVLRCDPLFPSKIAVEIAIANVMSKHIPGTRISISFIDLYKHVVKRFNEIGYDLAKLGLDESNFHLTIETRKSLLDLMCLKGVDMTSVSACGEPGITSEPCVSQYDCKILGVKWMPPAFKQRFACKCAGNKHEILSRKHQCGHGCIYCYWK